MKVLLISLYPPTRHNIGGPSSLPFYLAKFRPDTIEIDLFYYGGDEDNDKVIREDLQSVFGEITKIRQTPAWKYYPLRLLQETSLIHSLKGISLKHLPRKTDLKKVKEKKYDLIWIYTGLLFPWSAALHMFRQVMTGPDNLLLHHQLVKKIYIESQRPVPDNVSVQAAKKYFAFALHRERRWATSKALLHMVGDDDQKAFEGLGAASHSFFSPHPYYDFEPVHETIDTAKGKLTVLISGKNNSVYTGNFFDEVVSMLQQQIALTAHFRFLMIGKGFEAATARLHEAGYEAEQQQWVESYEKAIAGCHIQFFPIVLGTGTKGKVLCALATGLLCIGTRFAFENILIDLGEDAILINNEDARGVVLALQQIANNRKPYADKARRAADRVRHEHTPSVTAELFWQKVLSYWGFRQFF